MFRLIHISVFFFFNDTATTEIYTLSLHDALPIYQAWQMCCMVAVNTLQIRAHKIAHTPLLIDRKSTRLNSSHSQISYAVFCLKKKKTHCPSFRHLPKRLSSSTRAKMC